MSWNSNCRPNRTRCCLYSHCQPYTGINFWQRGQVSCRVGRFGHSAIKKLSCLTILAGPQTLTKCFCRDYRALAKAAVKLAIDAAKDSLKPTSIIDEDANLPRVGLPPWLSAVAIFHMPLCTRDHLPQAKPLFSYLLLALNVLVYAAGLGFRFLEGEDGPTDYFLALANVNDGIEAGEYYRCGFLATSTDCCLHQVDSGQSWGPLSAAS